MSYLVHSDLSTSKHVCDNTAGYVMDEMSLVNHMSSCKECTTSRYSEMNERKIEIEKLV